MKEEGYLVQTTTVYKMNLSLCLVILKGEFDSAKDSLRSNQTQRKNRVRNAHRKARRKKMGKRLGINAMGRRKEKLLTAHRTDAPVNKKKVPLLNAKKLFTSGRYPPLKKHIKDKCSRSGTLLA